jgi:hypothetical protein
VGILLKITLIVLFIFIFYQDYKTRLVYWFLYFFVGFFGTLLHLNHASWTTILFESILNISMILILIGLGFCYSKFILKKEFIDESIGKGDLFLFFSLCFLFPTIIFWVLFLTSLIFSLLIHFFVKKDTNIPLAGYMSLFFASILFTSLFLKQNILYLF